jgi:hypothetical protein
VFVLDVGGYIGDSTRSEIEHAQATGKGVRYLSKEHPEWTEADCKYWRDAPAATRSVRGWAFPAELEHGRDVEVLACRPDSSWVEVTVTWQRPAAKGDSNG